jgi:hypothetical protein
MVFLFGMSNLHHCQQEEGQQEEGKQEEGRTSVSVTSLGSAGCPVEITKLLYPPLFYCAIDTALIPQNEYHILRKEGEFRRILYPGTACV